MIRVEDVSFSYPGKPVFSHLNLTLPDTGTAALMAPSGYGKTTLLRLLAGLETPASGRITGLENRKTAFLFQEDRLLPWLTAEKNIALVSSAERAAYWLEKMEIDGGQYPREMSGGMQRRVALARAMAFGGDVLLLDEPFKGLDGTADRQKEKSPDQARSGDFAMALPFTVSKPYFSYSPWASRVNRKPRRAAYSGSETMWETSALPWP